MTQADKEVVKQQIKSKAAELGFDACGVAKVHHVDKDAVEIYAKWLADGKNGCMEWARNYTDIKENPELLLDGAKSVIALAMNYYPSRFQAANAAQVAYYAYGRDYHEVMRGKLRELAMHIKELTGCESRCCVDSAPIRERYWAQQAGLGFIGLNNALILPGKGSFFFLGVLVTQLELEPDEPCTMTCGNCHACERACPVHALSGGEPVDARRCLSCLTIECRGELPKWVGGVIGNRVYGCDECQKCCPHNRYPLPTDVEEFALREPLRHITHDEIAEMTDEQFRTIFSHSAIKRIKLTALKRNNQASASPSDDKKI